MRGPLMPMSTHIRVVIGFLKHEMKRTYSDDL